MVDLDFAEWLNVHRRFPALQPPRHERADLWDMLAVHTLIDSWHSMTHTDRFTREVDTERIKYGIPSIFD